jgi:hypothetical protein
MVEKRETANTFSFGDIRRTIETMMAAMGIHKDTRAQVQSHGLGGVQARHYDRHDYMPEKRAALEAWGNKIEEIANGVRRSNVRALKKR